MSRVDRAALLAVALAALTLSLHKLVAHDVWWQLATGALVLESGWPRTDPFSYLADGLPWIEMRWLYCVVARLLFDAGGIHLLILVKTVLVGAALTLLVASRRPGAPLWTALVGLWVALTTGHPRWTVRPELVSYLFVAWTLFALDRYRRTNARIWTYHLPALQLIWVNSHTLFVLGPVLQGLFVVGEWMRGRSKRPDATALAWPRLRAAVAATALSVLACLVNPYGVSGALFPLQLFGEIQEGHRLSDVIGEFRSPFEVVGLLHITIPYLLATLLGGTALLLRRRRRPYAELLIWLAFLYLSTLAHRNIALFGLVSAFITAWGFGDWACDRDLRAAGRARTMVVGWVCRVGILAAAVAAVPWVASDAYYRAIGAHERTGLGVSPRLFPLRALEFVRQESLPRRLVTKLGDAGYVLFVEGRRSVLIDGRLEVYGPELLPALRRLDTGEGWDRYARELDIRTAILLHAEQSALLAVLESLPNWSPVYFDPLHVIYVRRDATSAALVDRLEIDWSRPVTRQVAPPPWADPEDPTRSLWPRVGDPSDDAALAQLFANVGNLELAERHLRRTLEIWPAHRDASLLLSLVLEARGEAVEASELLLRVGARRADAPETWRARALLLLRAGKPAGALTAFRELLRRDSARPGDWADAARAALSLQDPAAAEEILAPACERFASDPRLWSLRALAARAAGRRTDTLAYLMRALPFDSDNPSLLNQIGISHLELGDPTAARQAFLRAIAADPAYALARDNLLRLESLTAGS